MFFEQVPVQAFLSSAIKFAVKGVFLSFSCFFLFRGGFGFDLLRFNEQQSPSRSRAALFSMARPCTDGRGVRSDMIGQLVPWFFRAQIVTDLFSLFNGRSTKSVRLTWS